MNHIPVFPPNTRELGAIKLNYSEDSLRMKMKKSSPSSSSHASSIITRVFPASWFSRFKQKGISNPETHHSLYKKQRGKLDFPSSCSIMTLGWREGIFYGFHDADDNDDDAYWRFSFYGDKIEGSRSTGGNGLEMTPLWYDSEDESRADMVSDIMRMKEKQQYHYTGNNREARFAATQRKEKSGGRPRKLSRGKKREAKLAREHNDEDNSPETKGRQTFATESGNLDMKEELVDSRSQQNVSLSNSSPCSAEEGLIQDDSKLTPEKASILDRQIFEDRMFKAARIKRNARRQSRGRKLKKIGEKACSPTKEFRIRVLDDMKKARMKSKERKAHGGNIFDSFAVIKTSTNPWQDFRDSMVEMINEKGIRLHEEFEELLAAYLTLNHDGHHGLIIKVFLGVCFELKKNVG